ncbi:hypothetical protein QG37_03589 [Candidozyma auris]|nr:hypothetical protein QG37_03589 [[Candida] auris]
MSKEVHWVGFLGVFIRIREVSSFVDAVRDKKVIALNYKYRTPETTIALTRLHTDLSVVDR